MPESQEHIDEYLLAAFLAGDLPQRLREEISAYLVTNDRARDLLAMAGDALYAADGGDGARSAPARKLRPARLDISGMMTAESASRRFAKSDESLWKTIIVVASTVLLLTVAVAWHISIDFRGMGGAVLDTEWVPSLAENRFVLAWEEVDGARSYRIILHDDVQDMPHAVGLTIATTFDASLSEAWPGRAAGAEAGHVGNAGTHTLWIEALDPDGNVLRRSAAIPVSHP
ncbi:MAG: hypothetical protein RIE53_07835 [Rhodothermales bacterium]